FAAFIGLAVAAGLAAVVAVNVVRESGVRTKGGESLSVMVKPSAAAAPHALQPGELLAAGDSIRFVVTPRRASHAGVLGFDGVGAVNVYVKDTSLVADQAQPLPGAVELDASRGYELVVVPLCDEAIDVAALERTAKEKWNAA